MLARLGSLLLDAIAPRRCAGCDSISSDPICTPCAEQLAAMSVPAPRSVSFGLAYAGFEFSDLVRAILHRGKYGGDHQALEALASIAARRLNDIPGRDAVIAVPLGPRRRRHRGYNQAEIVAHVFAGARRIPLVDGLRRTRETDPQTARDENSRRANVHGAFSWQGIDLRAAAIWLVDDVLTTGATVEAAAAELRHAGALRIDVVVIALVP